MEKIKILHCIETISSGGVEVLRLGFARNMDKTKFDLKIICTNAIGPIKKALEEEGIEIIEVGQFGSPFEPSKYLKVLNVIKHYSPHIVHGAVFEGMCMAAVGGFFGKVKGIILEETSDPSNRSLKAIFLQRLLASSADKIIGISPAVCEFLNTRVNIPESKIFQLSNGIDFNYLQAKKKKITKSQLGLSAEDFVIGAVGRVHDKVKRFSSILMALEKINKPTIKVLLIGDGPDLDDLRNLSCIKGISDQFITVGFREDTSSFYELMDCFCIPSANEGFGMVAAEAMFYKLPVIASNVGGLKNVVQDEITGILFQPNDINTLAISIIRLYEDNVLRKNMGEAGFLRTRSLFGISHYTEIIQHLYQTIYIEKYSKPC